MNKNTDFLTNKKSRKDLYKYIIFLLNIHVVFVPLEKNLRNMHFSFIYMTINIKGT